MNNRHTPGPWAVKGKAPGPVVYAEGRREHICVVQHDLDQPYQMAKETYAQAEADARVIAAAPDMLAACEEVAEIIHHRAGTGDPDLHRANEILRAAIAKAKGDE